MQFKQDMHVIGDIVHFDDPTFLLLENSLSEGVELSVRSFGKRCHPIFRAEDEMNEDL